MTVVKNFNQIKITDEFITTSKEIFVQFTDKLFFFLFFSSSKNVGKWAL